MSPWRPRGLRVSFTDVNRIAALLALVIVAGCRADAQAPSPTAPAAARPADYVKVIDGDTLEVAGETVRIENIDAPETPPRSRCWAEAALSLHATRALQGYVNQARGLRIERSGVDRYGRTLARVYSGERDLGLALIGNGVAAEWRGQRWDWCAQATLVESGGPSLAAGPSTDEDFLDWVDAREEDRLEEAARDAGFALKGPTAR